MVTKSETTIYDIAKALQLSPSTVSRALNGMSCVRDGTKTKILEKARSLGYRQNIFAARLRMQRTYVIGTVVSQLSNSSVSNIVSGTETAARLSGYNLIVRQSMERSEDYITSIETLDRNSVDGLIITSSSILKPVSAQDADLRLNIPAVVIERFLPFRPQSGTSSTNFYQTGYSMTNHLIGIGCRRIAYVTTHWSNPADADVYDGYSHALVERGIMENMRIESSGAGTDKLGIHVGREFDSMIAPPDAVVYSGSAIAALHLAGFKSQGPRAKAGKEDKNDTARDQPSNIDGHPLSELGRFATQLLIYFIENTFH